MKINFTNVNFEKDINLPENIQTLNNDIKKICNELPALNIVKDVSLLDYTIEQTKKFKRNKKYFVIFGTGGYSSGLPLLAAIHKGIKTVIQEQNSFPGITTRHLSSRVNKICIAYKEAEKHLKKKISFLQETLFGRTFK